MRLNKLPSAYIYIYIPVRSSSYIHTQPATPARPSISWCIYTRIRTRQSSPRINFLRLYLNKHFFFSLQRLYVRSETENNHVAKGDSIAGGNCEIRASLYFIVGRPPNYSSRTSFCSLGAFSCALLAKAQSSISEREHAFYDTPGAFGNFP